MKFLLYLGRWQLSTPILAIVTAKLAFMGYWKAAMIANLIGGCLFFWIDRLIFRENKKRYAPDSAKEDV